MKLSIKLTMLFSGIILLMGSISCYGIYNFQNNILQKEITEKLQNLAASHLDKLDRVLAEGLNDVEALSINPVIASRKSIPAQIQNEIEKFLNRYPQYAAVSFYDMNRIKIASIGQGTMDIGAPHPWDEYWPAVYGGRDLIVDVSVSKSLKAPTVHLVNPVKDDQGVAFGIVVVRIPLADLFKLVGGAKDIDSNTPKYNVDILDKEGLVLYSNHNKTAILKETDNDFVRIKNRLPLVKDVGSLTYQGEQNYGTERQKESGEILVFAKEQGYRKFNGNGWVLKIKLTTNDAFAPVNTLGKKMAILLSGVTLLAIAAVLAVLLFMVIRPLKKLNEATVRLGKGDLGIRVAVESGDEIGKLAESFNEMSAHLKEGGEHASSLSESLASTLNDLNSVMEANPDILYVFNMKGELIKWNSNFEKFCGLAPHQMMNRPIAEFVCKEDRPTVEKGVMEVFENGSSSVEARLLKHDGARVPYWCNGVVLKNLSGEVIGITGTGRDISERRMIEEKILRLAHYDSLTGLPNRVLLTDRLLQALAKAKRDKAYLAIIFIDLDRFKPINDEFGHSAGDLLLNEVATRLRGCVRESDTVARIGGDEFIALLFPAIKKGQDAMVVAEKILHAVSQPFELAGHSLHISSSIGVAVYPEHGNNERLLLINADIAMYHAKKSGRNNVKLYQPGMQA